MKLFDILEKCAIAYPEKAAAVQFERRMSYSELLDSSTRIAEYLVNLRLSIGSRVAILFENSPEYIISFFAVQKAGFVAVPIDTSLNPAKMNYIMSDCEAKVLLMQAKYERLLPGILGDGSSVRTIITDKELGTHLPQLSFQTFKSISSQFACRVSTPNHQVTGKPLTYDLDREVSAFPTELAAIFYTSGSTGSPKGVMLSHRNLISNTIATIEYLKLSSEDSVMVILPFYYIYGNSLLLTHIMAGGTLVIDNRFMYPEVVLDTMEKERVTGFSGVPSNFMILLNNSSFVSRKFEHLRYFTQAGGALAPEFIRRLMTAFPQKEIYIMYGQTEAAPRISYVPSEHLTEKIGSIGIPVPGVKMAIIGEDGHELPPGLDGEIAVSGDNVMMGYWNQPEEQKSVLRDGWLLTGDLGRMDNDGYFYVVGRKKEIIKAGGNRVSAKEVEECILENEKVAEATVFGVNDDILGEAIKAVVVLREGAIADRKELQNFCKSRLADYKVPKYVEFIGSLPKYKSGKVNKLELMKRGG